jgi:hypothetical protein
MDFLCFAGRAALAVWLLGGAGCSLALKTDAEQCTADADCTSRGPTFADTVCIDDVCHSKWGCIGNVPPLPHGSMTTVDVQILDLLSMAPVTSDSTVMLSLKLCAKLDPPCTSPLSSPTLDSMANVSVTLASDFDGYLDISDASGKYLPALIFLDLVAVAKNAQILLVSKSEETGLLAAAGITPVMGTGLLLVPTVDCTSARTAGVSVTMSPSGGETRFYAINNVPMTSAMQTDSAGNAGFVNVAAGDVSVTGTLGQNGKEMGKVGTLVRAGSMTYQLLRPTSTL